MTKRKSAKLLHKKIRRLLSNESSSFLRDINEHKHDGVYGRFHFDLQMIIEPPIELTDLKGAAKHFDVHINTIRYRIKKGKLKRDFFDSNRVELGSVPKSGIAFQLLDEINLALQGFRPIIATDGRKVFFTAANPDGFPISKYQQVKVTEELQQRQIFGSVLLWVQYGQLLIEMSPDWDRLKECNFCKNIYWDDSPNKVQAICGSIKCIRLRGAQAAKASRVKKILESMKSKSAPAQSKTNQPAAKAAKTKRS